MMSNISFDRSVAKNEREHVGGLVNIAKRNGRVNPAAISWSRFPHINANLRGWGRRKRFEYWAISTPDLVFAFSFSHADYRAGLAIYALDLATRAEVNDGEAHWFPGRVDLPPTSGIDAMGRVGKHTNVRITPNTEGTLLEVTGRRVTARIQIIEPEGHQSMGVVVPWNDKTFQYTRKDGALRARGEVTVDGRVYPVSADSSWAALDHGRGRWPFKVTWNWAAGAGISDGHEIGVQLGAKWTDGTPSTENSIRIDGVVHKLSHDVEWTYDTSDFMKPWRFVGPQVDLTFTPVHNRHSETKKYFFMSREDQAFGWWDGTISTADGTTYKVEKIFGWAEEVARRW